MPITVRVFPFCYKWNIRSVDRRGLHRTLPNICAASIDHQHINSVNRCAGFAAKIFASRVRPANSSANVAMTVGRVIER
jgi:hypothetical protein